MVTIATTCNNKQQSADSSAPDEHHAAPTQVVFLSERRTFVPSGRTLLIICCGVLRTEPQVEAGIYPELRARHS